MARGRGRRDNDAGALASNYPKPMRWKLDCDYLDALTPAERQWYAQFLDGHYGGAFKPGQTDWSADQKREAWSNQRATRQDAIGLACLANGPDEIPLNALDETPRDWATPPAYLDDPEYKAARDEYRSHLGQHRRFSSPDETPALLKARRSLSVLTPTAPVVVPKPRKKAKAPK